MKVQKLYIRLNENNSSFRFILVSCQKSDVATLIDLYKEATSDFSDLEYRDVNIGISKDEVYKNRLYVFFDKAILDNSVLDKYFKVKNFI